MQHNNSIGILGQWLSLIATLIGFIIMIFHSIPIWHDFITGGALLLTIATKIRYYGGEYIRNNKRRKHTTILDIIDKQRKHDKVSITTI